MEITNFIVNWICLLTVIVSCFVSIIYQHRKNLIAIQLYIIVSIFANLVFNICDMFPLDSFCKKIEQVVFNIYTLFEILLIYFFLYYRLTRKGLKKTMLIFLGIYISICCISWIYYDLFFSFAPDLSGIEGLLITAACAFYLYEIFKSDLHNDLKSDANFIATCGILFYFSVSIPAYFNWYNLHYTTPEFEKIVIFGNSLFYILLFISFMKAYICPIPNQKQ